MNVGAAIRAVAASRAVADAAIAAWQEDADKLAAIGVNTEARCAMLIGQCAHESARFTHRFENLNYSADGLWRVFRRHFFNRQECDAFARQPEKIANRVYANRMGNGTEASGDGWRYRGRGYLQLTGKSNYEKYGKALGLDLVGNPDLAADPAVAWQIAARYCATKTRSGKTLLEWADVPDTTLVTKGINGGLNGLADREHLTAQAMAALSGQVPVIEQQRLLAAAGYDPGALDGLMGPDTQRAINAASARLGAAGADLWNALQKVA
jgi:putative chitinase